MGVNLNAHYFIEERLIHACGRRAKRANLKRSHSSLVLANQADRVLLIGYCFRQVTGLDPDQFGTCSREIERTGSQRDAASAKIAAIST